MALLLDTHILVWFATDDPKLSRAARNAIADPRSDLFVSAVIAFEFEDLRAKGRLGDVGGVGEIVEQIEARLLDFPAEAYRLISLMPMPHGDPIDRMLVAHAIHADLTIVTADRMIRRYPVRTIR